MKPGVTEALPADARHCCSSSPSARPAGATRFSRGTWLTIRLALATLPVGLALGFLVALAKRSQSTLAARLRRSLLDGLPRPAGAADALHHLSTAGSSLLQAIVRLFTDATVEANGFLAGMLALGVVFAAYASEVFTAAFNGIPVGQWEGAAALGLHRWQTMRLVILPQLLRLALPGLANLWLVLLKETSLVSVIALERPPAHDLRSPSATPSSRSSSISSPA